MRAKATRTGALRGIGPVEDHKGIKEADKESTRLNAMVHMAQQ